MTFKNPSLCKVRWIEKMISFNFIIHYKLKVKMSYIDFTLRMKTFLPKNSTSILISTLRKS